MFQWIKLDAHQLEDALTRRKSADTFGNAHISSIIDTYSRMVPWHRAMVEALEPLMLAARFLGEKFDIHCSMRSPPDRRPGPLLRMVSVAVFVRNRSDVNAGVGATLILTFCNLASRLV